MTGRCSQVSCTYRSPRVSDMPSSCSRAHRPFRTVPDRTDLGPGTSPLSSGRGFRGRTASPSRRPQHELLDRCWGSLHGREKVVVHAPERLYCTRGSTSPRRSHLHRLPVLRELIFRFESCQIVRRLCRACGRSPSRRSRLRRSHLLWSGGKQAHTQSLCGAGAVLAEIIHSVTVGTPSQRTVGLSSFYVSRQQAWRQRSQRKPFQPGRKLKERDSKTLSQVIIMLPERESFSIWPGEIEGLCFFWASHFPQNARRVVLLRSPRGPWHET